MVKKAYKLIICIFIIMAILLESSITTLAAIASSEAGAKAVFGVEQLHDSNTLDGSGHMKIGYRVDAKNIYRIYNATNNELDFETTLLCLDKDGRFPSQQDASGRVNRGNYTSLGEANANTLNAAKRSIDAEGSKRITWLINNAILPEDSDALQKQRISEVFDALISSTATDVNPVRVEDIRSVLTKDDLVIAMQLAIWQVTNNFTPGTISGTYDGITFDGLTGNSIFSRGGVKGEYIKYLYNYYVSHWDEDTTASGTNPVVSKPETDNQTIELEREGAYVFVGPFKINHATNQYTVDITFNAENGDEVTGISYLLTDKKDGKGVILTPNKEGLDGKEFYVRLRANSQARSVTVTAIPKIHTKNTKGYVWKSDEEGNQPILSIEREEETPQPSKKTIKFTLPTLERKWDSSLRKYIVGYYTYNSRFHGWSRVTLDGEDSRKPVISLALNKDRQYNEYSYVHRKDPLKTEVGTQIIYRIEVFNEGEEQMRITSITDNLPPSGLRLPDQENEPEAYNLNASYGWVYNSSNNSVTTTYEENKILDPAENGTSQLHSRYVDLALVVTDQAKGKIITNIAEITGYQTIPADGIDHDSGYSTDDADHKRAQLPKTEYDWEMYDGLLNRDFFVFKADWFKGQEDDDDFEKIEVPGETEIDLALRKSIYEVSGKSYSREVKPDTSPLEAGQTTSKFSDKKDPITVKVGDKVKYRIRVFNEGNQDGYASRIEDYLPKGLGYLPEYTTNIENDWKVDSSAGETTLGEIENATSNFRESEFKSGVSLQNAKVIKGQATIYSTKLAQDNLTNYIANNKDLDIHSLEVVCVVLDEVPTNTIIKNISAITGYRNATKEDVDKDRDSQPNQIAVNSYPDNDHIQDDDDFEKILYVKDPKVYDLALKKFITKVTSESGQVKTLPESQKRYCQVENTDMLKNREGTAKATATYSLNKTKVDVQNHDTVVYTIRVFNEGRQDGKVGQLIDTVPTGLAFIEDSQINRENGWHPYTGQEPGWTNVIATEKLADVTIPAFDNSQSNGTNKEKGLSYRDVQVEFKVLLDELDKDTLENIYSNGIKNISEITEDDGDDNDSDPNDKKETEDDQDYDIIIPPAPERFDLALKKFIVSINGGEQVQNRFLSVNSDNLANDGHDADYELDKTVIKVKSGKNVVYTIRVFNEGSIDGYVKELRDTLPEGLKFVPKEDSEINSHYNWNERDGQVYTDYLKDEKIPAYNPENRATDEARHIIDGISYRDVQIELTMISKDPSKTIVNIAEITLDANDKNREDPDSDPNNDNPQEDDQDYDNIIPTVYDLALKKSVMTVTSANGTIKVLPEDQKRSIEVTSTDKLKNRGAKANADYKLNKTPVSIADGDIVTYTIRVFNEGNEDAIVKELVDTIPEGLVLAKYETNSDGTYKSGSKTNCKYRWTERKDNGSGRLTGVVTDYLKDTVIEKFDESQADGKNKVKGLSYADVEIEFIVSLENIPDNTYQNIMKNGIKNIAEITEDDGDDTDSEPDDNDPNEDDEDYDIIIPKEFDLALRKFITQIDEKQYTNRIPQVSLDNGEIKYSHPKDSLVVVKGQTVIYTIRVFNEGTQNGYASEITDDLPTGITFLPDHATNKKYKWKMIDKDGKETEDVSKAVKVTTDYLSREQENKTGENLLKAFDKTKPVSNTNPDYKDVQIAFKVTKDDPTVNPRVITNTAQISEDTDEKGNEVEDKDSIPGNDLDGEDDIDVEHIELKVFDLSLLKYVSEVVVNENGQEKSIITNYTGLENPEPVVKVELDYSRLPNTQIKYIYTIKITNEGDIEGYAKEITDRIPNGLAFNEEDNTEYKWKVKEGGIVTTDYLKDKLLRPGESAELKIVLRWVNSRDNMGQKVNVAEITKDENEYGVNDIDSTPNNNKDGEDDQDNAIVLLLTNTGSRPIHITLIITVISLLGTGMYLIKRYVL